MPEPLLAVAVTHTDYIWQNLVVDWVRRGAPGGAEYFGVENTPTHTVSPWPLDEDHFWSEAGLRRLVSHLADRGVNRIYWRTHGGGRAFYPSNVSTRVDMQHRTDKPCVSAEDIEAGLGNYSTFDPTPTLVDEAHRRGIQVYAWFTGCEDDHGGSGRNLSGFAAEHPECLQENRSGKKLYGNLSFAYPEVLTYKQSLLREFLGYGYAGLLLDCSRENSFSIYKLDYTFARNGQRRVPQGGYETPVRDAFEAQFGMDPRRLATGTDAFELWWRFKSRYYPTPLVQLCAEESRAHEIPFEVLIRRGDNFDTYGLDVEHWIDQGWLDAVCPIMPGLYYPGATHGYYLDDKPGIAGMFQGIQQLARGRCEVRWLNYLYPLSAVLGYHGKVHHPIWGIPASPPPGPLQQLLRGRVELARQAGADGFIAFEANHLDAWDLWPALEDTP